MIYTVDTHGLDFTLNSDGSYKAGKQSGVVNIYVKSEEHPDMMQSTIVTVKKCRMANINLGSDITKKWDNTKKEVTLHLNAAISAEEGGIYEYITDKEVEWMTSNSQLCKVEPLSSSADHGIGREMARVNITQPGLYTVYASAKNTGLNPGAYDSCNIRVEGIKKDNVSLGVRDGDELDLKKYLIAFDSNNNTEIDFSISNQEFKPIIGNYIWISNGVLKTNGFWTGYSMFINPFARTLYGCRDYCNNQGYKI